MEEGREWKREAERIGETDKGVSEGDSRARERKGKIG
mgnify:CR=1 FL=1